MAKVPVILDQYGQPVRPELLTREIAMPTVTGLRSPIAGYPGDGLDPVRLATILRAADIGQPLQFFELAEQIEERDAHYAGILGTRKRSVSQLNIQVDAGEDTPDGNAMADMVRSWLKREELETEMFNMLDAIGKGISFSEIVWEISEGQRWPKKLVWKDPRWFNFDPKDGTTPLLIGGYDSDGVGSLMHGSPFPAFKFISTVIRSKSGLPVRSGVGRLATWSWMFKAFTLRDWAIFTQTFGQPVRVGKYPNNSSESEKDTLFDAVANIAGDCAAIIPQSMTIEFIESANVNAGKELYITRANWLDQQMSKAVLGQTATTDAIAGGHAVGQEHRQVQEDIERADAKALSAILNTQLIQPWIMLERGPQKNYPRLRIGREEEENLAQTIDGVIKLVPFGLPVEISTMLNKLGLPEPKAGAKLMTAPAALPPAFGGFDKGLQATGQPQLKRTADDVVALAAAAEHLTQPAFDELVGHIRTALQSASSLQEVRTRLGHLKLDDKKMADALRLALVMAQLSGRETIVDASQA